MSSNAANNKVREAIFSVLDGSARSCNFPVLDNSAFVTFSGRLAGYRSGRDWALLISAFGFSETELAFPIDVYCYGSMIPTGYALRQVTGVELDPDLWNARAEWDPNQPFQARLDNRILSVGCVEHASFDVIVTKQDLMSEVTFGHALVRELGCQALLPRTLWRAACPEAATLSLVVQLDDWDHPVQPANHGIGQSLDLQWCCDRLAGMSTVEEVPPVGFGLRSEILLRRRL